jgi:hypothetical protein
MTTFHATYRHRRHRTHGRLAALVAVMTLRDYKR